MGWLEGSSEERVNVRQVGIGEKIKRKGENLDLISHMQLT